MQMLQISFSQCIVTYSSVLLWLLYVIPGHMPWHLVAIQMLKLPTHYQPTPYFQKSVNRKGIHSPCAPWQDQHVYHLKGF